MSIEQENKIQQWKCLIQKCIQSNLRVSEWCMKNNVTKGQYYYWLNKIHKIESSLKNQEKTYESSTKGSEKVIVNESELEVGVVCVPTVEKEVIEPVVNKVIEEKEENAFIELSPHTIMSEKLKSENLNPSAKILVNNLEIELFEQSSSSFIRKIMEAVKYA